MKEAKAAGEEVNEPHCEKTGLHGFLPGPTQLGCAVTEDGLKFLI